MKPTLLACSLLVLAAGTRVVPTAQQDGQDPQGQMAEMMAKVAKLTRPGKHHEELRRFLGTWDTEMRMFMGGQATPPDKGTWECKWLMDGRWLEARGKGTMMGQPSQSFMLMGYDNFKQSFVSTYVSSFDTAMLEAEGDMTPDGKSLITYGTLDEYLTGEHDKMVKYAWRFLSEDEIVLEVHDLPIGETNTKVVEVRYKRRK
ncbi:MAG: DUF1579 family protein [Planctomycetota bacterium]